jgi:hypothetical protein
LELGGKGKMVDLPSREERNKLRQVVNRAKLEDIITQEEAGFVITLVERFRSDIDKKIKDLHVLEGQIAQLRINEQIIIQLIENMVAAAERDLARQETMEKLKAAREIEEARIAERQANKASNEELRTEAIPEQLKK